MTPDRTLRPDEVVGLAKHTGGTWAVVSDKGDDITVCAFDGDPRDGIMADVIAEIVSVRDEDDACLIATAPELLERLREACDMIVELTRFANNNGGMFDEEDFPEGRAAILKASGGAS